MTSHYIILHHGITCGKVDVPKYTTNLNTSDELSVALCNDNFTKKTHTQQYYIINE